MSENEDCQSTETAVNAEEEEMVLYKKCAVNVVTFRIVYDDTDLETPSRKSNSFNPEMAHQIFGDSEMIFGYRHLSINLFYLHNSAKCYLDLQASGKVTENDLKPDDIMLSLNSWLPENFTTSKKVFLKQIAEEDPTVIHGEVIHAFKGDRDKSYKVTVCDITDPEFRNFHQRFETFIVWFIDGANFIDLEDSRWSIFYIYEEYLDETSKKICYSPIAFCTVYKFFLYPNSTRPRISQFFVLPTHQRRGIATKLYSAVFNYLKVIPEVEDITVEEPTPVFQKIRDYCDSLYIYKDLEDSKVNITTQNHKQINTFLKKHKICKRQAQRVFDILECLATHKNGYKEYVKFTESIKTRISNDIERETRGSKRICNLERAGVVVEPLDKKNSIDAEYNKYIDSLEWPVNRLMSHLAKEAAK